MEKITKIKQLPLKIILLLVINDTVDTSAQLLMKKGIHHLLNFGSHDFFTSWIGISLYAFNFFLWMKILSNIDLSIALPLASSSYILIPLGAVFFLHEQMHLGRWIGLLLIVVGIYFISQSKSSEAGHE